MQEFGCDKNNTPWLWQNYDKIDNEQVSLVMQSIAEIRNYV